MKSKIQMSVLMTCLIAWGVHGNCDALKKDLKGSSSPLDVVASTFSAKFQGIKNYNYLMINSAQSKAVWTCIQSEIQKILKGHLEDKANPSLFQETVGTAATNLGKLVGRTGSPLKAAALRWFLQEADLLLAAGSGGNYDREGDSQSPYHLLKAELKRMFNQPPPKLEALGTFLTTQLTTNAERFFKGYNDLEYVALKDDIQSTISSEETREQLIGIVENARKSLPLPNLPEDVKKETENSAGEVQAAYTDARRLPRDAIRDAYSGLFAYYDPAKFQEHPNKPQMDYIFVDLYHFLCMVRAKTNIPFTDPLTILHQALEFCMESKDSSVPPSAFESSFCVYPYKSYSQIYFLVKAYIIQSNPTKAANSWLDVSFKLYGDKVPVTNARAFLTLAQVTPDLAAAIKKGCTPANSDGANFCGVAGIFATFADILKTITDKKAEWIEWQENGGFQILNNDARKKVFVQIHVALATHLPFESKKTAESKIKFLAALEAAFFQIGYNQEAFEAFSKAFLNPKFESGEFEAAIKGVKSLNDKSISLTSLLNSFDTTNIDRLASYFQKTHTQTRLRPEEAALADAINAFLENDKEKSATFLHLRRKSDFLKLFTTEKGLSMQHFKLFLTYARSEEAYKKLAGLATVKLKVTELATLNNPLAETQYQEWGAALAKLDSRVVSVDGHSSLDAKKILPDDLEKCKKELLRLLAEDYKTQESILEATEPEKEVAFQRTKTLTKVSVSEKIDKFESKEVRYPPGKYTKEQLSLPPCTVDLVASKTKCIVLPYRALSMTVTKTNIVTEIFVQKSSIKINLKSGDANVQEGNEDIRDFISARVSAKELFTEKTLASLVPLVKLAGIEEPIPWEKILVNTSTTFYSKALKGERIEADVTSLKATMTEERTEKVEVTEAKTSETKSLKLSPEAIGKVIGGAAQKSRRQLETSEVRI